jgi:TnpA family transposase
MVRKGIPALERDRLLYVQQNYIRPDTLSRANARLVDYQATIPLAKSWGGGEVASADGLRFVAPLRTFNAGPNPKYLRVAGSLKLDTVNVTELLRALQGNGHPSTLSKAIAELGRIAKSLYLLSYIDDPTYRRHILIQLNKGESRHSLARATYFGQKGEVRQRYREGQEEQLGALGNAMILWNTSYMHRTLEEMRGRGMKIAPEDVERLSPLGYDHINLLGRYTFSLPEEIRQRAFYPLRELEEAEQEEAQEQITETPQEEAGA